MLGERFEKQKVLEKVVRVVAVASPLKDKGSRWKLVQYLP